MNKEIYYILSIDGGGIRGIFPAYILAQIEQQLKINLYERFDFFTGTSTGSIIAAAAACEINMQEIQELYEKEGKNIFKKSIWSKYIRMFFVSLYKNNYLKKKLQGNLGNKKMKDIAKDKKLMIPASDISTGDVYVIKSSYDDSFVRDPETLISDAVLASCAAPIFFDPIRINQALLADGGLWVNNPSLAAVIEAMRLGVKKENIRILSIGTGEETKVYDHDEERKCWGLLRWWPSIKLLPLILSLQSKSTHNYLSLFLDKEQICRINFKIKGKIGLDDADAINKLLSQAEKIFTNDSKKIKNFLTE